MTNFFNFNLVLGFMKKSLTHFISSLSSFDHDDDHHETTAATFVLFEL